MKYCPYCGEGLREPEVRFCPECGKQFLAERLPMEFPGPEEEKAPESTGKEAKRKWFETAKEKANTVPLETPDLELPEDDGYDGYYDDVLPADLDDRQDGIDKGLIQKIVLLAAGVVLVVVACVAMMCLL